MILQILGAWLFALAAETNRQRQISYQLGYFGPIEQTYSAINTPLLQTELERGRAARRSGVEYDFTEATR